MSLELLEDVRDFVQCLNEAGVEYLVIGAHALSVYGISRATGDFDVFVRASQENVTKSRHQSRPTHSEQTRHWTSQRSA